MIVNIKEKFAKLNTWKIRSNVNLRVVTRINKFSSKSILIEQMVCKGEMLKIVIIKHKN